MAPEEYLKTTDCPDCHAEGGICFVCWSVEKQPEMIAITPTQAELNERCQHDDEGPVLLFNNEGQYFKRDDVPVCEVQADDFLKFNRITGSCVSCSKCGQLYNIDLNVI